MLKNGVNPGTPGIVYHFVQSREERIDEVFRHVVFIGKQPMHAFVRRNVPHRDEDLADDATIDNRYRRNISLILLVRVAGKCKYAHGRRCLDQWN